MVLRIIAFLALGIALMACSMPQPTSNQKVAEVSTPSATPVATKTPSFVRDEQAAIEIAYETWIFPYGKETIDGEKPYMAELKKGVWHVYGSLPKGAVGGVAEAWISQTDGHVIRYMHGE